MKIPLQFTVEVTEGGHGPALIMLGGLPVFHPSAWDPDASETVKIQQAISGIVDLLQTALDDARPRLPDQW